MAKSKSDQRIINVILIILIIYNLVFLACEFYPERTAGITQKIYDVILENRSMITFLEFLGVAVVFVDLIISFDRHKKSTRLIILMATAVVSIMFVLKIFMTYLKAFSESGSQA